MTGIACQLFVVERYAPVPSVAGARAEAARIRAAARELQYAGVAVEHLGSLLLPGDETSFVLFESESLDAVRLLNERLALTFERIVPAVPVDLNRKRKEYHE
jgi:hypothetical protein